MDSNKIKPYYRGSHIVTLKKQKKHYSTTFHLLLATLLLCLVILLLCLNRISISHFYNAAEEEYQEKKLKEQQEYELKVEFMENGKKMTSERPKPATTQKEILPITEISPTGSEIPIGWLLPPHISVPTTPMPNPYAEEVLEEEEEVEETTMRSLPSLSPLPPPFLFPYRPYPAAFPYSPFSPLDNPDAFPQLQSPVMGFVPSSDFFTGLTYDSLQPPPIQLSPEDYLPQFIPFPALPPRMVQSDDGQYYPNPERPIVQAPEELDTSPDFNADDSLSPILEEPSTSYLEDAGDGDDSEHELVENLFQKDYETDDDDVEAINPGGVNVVTLPSTEEGVLEYRSDDGY